MNREELMNGKRLPIKLDGEKVQKLRLLDLKVKSYDNLFMSYMNNTNENFNEFNLQKFLKIYFEVKFELDDIVESTVKNFLKENEIYDIKISHSVDLNEGVIFIGGAVCPLKKGM